MNRRCGFDNHPWETASIKDDDARDCNLIVTPGFMYSHLLLGYMSVQFCDAHTSQQALSFKYSKPSKCIESVSLIVIEGTHRSQLARIAVVPGRQHNS